MSGRRFGGVLGRDGTRAPRRRLPVARRRAPNFASIAAVGAPDRSGIERQFRASKAGTFR